MAVATERLLPEHPLRDAALESDMDSLGIAWSFEPALIVKRVDKERSLANQARLEPLHLATVEQYAEDMSNGDAFPPIVVEVQRTTRTERLVAVGGNHRLAAALIAKRNTLSAYLVTGDAVALYRLMWSDNRRHGLPPGNAEKLMAAVHLVGQGDTMATAARTVGITYATLVAHCYALESDERAKRLGIVGWPYLKQGLRTRLRTLDSDDTFAAAAQIIIDFELAQHAASDLVQRINAAGDNGMAVAASERLRLAERCDEPKHRGKLSERERMTNALIDLRWLDVKKVLASCDSDKERATLAEQIRVAAKVMQRVLRAVS